MMIEQRLPLKVLKYMRNHNLGWVKKVKSIFLELDLDITSNDISHILVQLSNDIFLLKRVSRYGRCFMIDSGSKGCPEQESAGCHFGTLGRNF